MEKLLRIFTLLLTTFLTGTFHFGLAQRAVPAKKLHSESDTRATKELKTLLLELESQYGVYFNYSSEVVRNKLVPSKPVKVKLPELEQYLRNLLKPLGLEIEKLKEGEYLIYATGTNQHSQNEAGNALLAGESGKHASTNRQAKNSAAITITGRVTAKGSGEALPGVNVVVKGTYQGTITDKNGNYILQATDEQAAILFSSIGYASEEIVLGTQKVVDITLNPGIQSLNEVVVVGFGTQRVSDLTGSIASISEREIKQYPTHTFEQALQGRVAGLYASSINGAPGGGMQIRVRGVGSVTQSSDPLYVIDGLPLFGDDYSTASNIAGQNGSGPGVNPGSVLASINPSDIESIDVLKDASATAIYGARAANGVILITTKRGKAGATQITLDAYTGVQQVQRVIPMMNATQYAQYSNEARLNNGEPIAPMYVNPYAFGRGTDWQKEIFRLAAIQNYSLHVTGGSEKTQFAIVGGYFNQQGILLGSDFQRASLRINIDHRIGRRLKAGVSLAPSYQHNNIFNTDNVFEGRLLGALRAVPTMPVYVDGTYAGRPKGKVGYADTRNVVAELNSDYNEQIRYRLLTNLFAEYELKKDLTFRSAYGVDFMYTKQLFEDPIYKLYGGFQQTKVHNILANNDYINWNADQTLTYNHTFNQDHSLTALLGFSAQSYSRTNYYVERFGGVSIQMPNIDGGPQTILASGSKASNGLVSSFTRLNYSFADRYLLTATVRRDGSSKFGRGKKYGLFPSASLGWRISGEGFMQKQNLISDLKLRASYGLTGNQNIGDFAYLSTTSPQNYVWGEVVGGGIIPNNFKNDKLQWEASRQFDAGIDIELLRGKITFTGDYFIKRSDRLLIDVPLPGTVAIADKQTLNLGKIENKGFEVTLRTHINISELKWSTNFTLATFRNQVLDLVDSKNEYFSSSPFLIGKFSTTKEGYPVGAFWTYVFDGIYQNGESSQLTNYSANPGDVRYKQLDANTTRLTDADRTFTGQPQPKWYGGITNTLEYKGFGLNVLVNFVQGNKIYNGGRVYGQRQDGYWNNRAEVVDRWSPSHPSTTIPRAGGNPFYNTLPSTRFLEDGSYVRIKNITLSYKLSTKFISRARLQSTRVYIGVANAFTFTRYSGYDPEVNSLSGDPLSQGIDLIGYPQPRMYTLGLTVNF